MADELSAVEVADASEAVEALADVEEASEADDESVPELDPDPEELFPLFAIVTLHDLVSRTNGSPLSPVMGSS